MFGQLSPQEAGRRGGLARVERLRADGTLTIANRKARAAVSSSSCAANGAKGFAALVAKHGDHQTALRQVWSAERQRRLNKPSSAEQRMMSLLDRLGLVYEREALIEGDDWITIDFALCGRVALFVDGPCHYEPAILKPRTVRRDAYLNTRLPELGWIVLRIRDTEIGAAAERILKLVGAITED